MAPHLLLSASPRSASMAASLHAQLAVLNVIRGNLAAARGEVAASRALEEYQYGSHLAAWLVALVDPTFDPALDAEDASFPFDAGVQTRRTGVAEEVYGCEAQSASAFARAFEGDGRELATLLRQCTIHGLETWRLIGIAPKVKRHREELAAAARFQRDFLWSEPRDLPFDVIRAATRARVLSGLLGDNEEAVRWQAIIDRQAAPLADPRVVVALIVLQELGRGGV
jgi:hypothetical protein